MSGVRGIRVRGTRYYSPGYEGIGTGYEGIDTGYKGIICFYPLPMTPTTMMSLTYLL